MSFQTIRNGLVATIVAGGKWSAAEVSTCDTGMMTLSGSCVFLQPGPATIIQPITYGDVSATAGARGKRIIYDIAGRVFIKDTGDSTTFMAKLWQAVDDIFDSIDADDTLGGNAMAAMIVRMGRPSMDEFLEGEGGIFGYVDFAVQAEETVR